MRLGGRRKGFWTAVLLLVAGGDVAGGLVIAGMWPIAVIVVVLTMTLFSALLRRSAETDPRPGPPPTP